MNKKVLSFVNKLEGYKTAIKQLHWNAKNMSQHELCDDIAESIAEFQDTVSEVEQSITGKLKINSLKPTEYKIKDLKSFVEDVLDATNSFYKEVKDMGDTYVGMASDCESFLSDMQRKLYLVNFTLKEELKNRLKERINESMPKNLSRHDEVDKFMGRKPKSIKARINQIYRIVKKYGIDSKVYHDENWQAISDYYRAISSLGCEVDMKPCGHISNMDSMQSDGGYCDYAEDGMPRSKQYAVKIMFEDGMNIDGYIKCMAAGTVSDPFSSYDTCIVLWPKNSRTLKGEGVVEDGVNEYGDTQQTRSMMGAAAKRGIMNGNTNVYHNAMNSLGKRMSSKDEYGDFQKGFEMEGKEIKLSESELKQVIKEAATKLIKEYGDTPKGQYNLGKLAARQRYRDNDTHKAARTEYYAGFHAPEDDRKYKQWARAGEVGYHDGRNEFSKETDESIEIKPENKGKFTATKKATGKSTEELTHSKNPLTRKRAIFAQNAKKWAKK